MGFIIVAKGKQGLFFLSELAWAIVAASMAWFCIKSYGLNGAGIAFFGSYVFHGFLTYPIVRRLSGFGWSATNRRTGLLFLSLIATVFCGFYLLPFTAAIIVGVLALLGSGAYSIRILFKLVPIAHLPRPLQRLMVGSGFMPVPTKPEAGVRGRSFAN